MPSALLVGERSRVNSAVSSVALSQLFTNFQTSLD
jgi:hypothetical protein